MIDRGAKFATAAAHDLQEPLRAIAGCARLLSRRFGDRLDPGAQELIRHIVEGAERSRSLVDGLLELARAAGDVQDVVLESGEVAQAALNHLAGAIAEHGARVTVGPLPRVRGHRAQLLQVFQNLIGNALEYRGPDPPHVVISAEEEGAMVRFSVRDNGIGIDRRDHLRIFEPLQRLHTREEHPGNGLGLALCAEHVRRRGGRIWVESSPGEGSTFSFTWPDAAA